MIINDFSLVELDVFLRYKTFPIFLSLLLLSSWFPVLIYSLITKKKELLLLGISLFLLFFKEWIFFVTTRHVVFNFELPRLSLNFNEWIFWELFLTFLFFWVFLKIYQSPKILRNQGLFYVDPRSSKLNGFFSQYGLNVFSPIGGVCCLIALIVMTTLIPMPTLLVFLSLFFYGLMIYTLEKKFFFIQKDFTYFGSPWIHSSVIMAIKFFLYTFFLVFVAMLILAILHHSNKLDFISVFNKIETYLYGVKTVSFGFLQLFIVLVFTQTNHLNRQSILSRKQHQAWAKKLEEELLRQNLNEIDSLDSFLLKKVLEQSNSELAILYSQDTDTFEIVDAPHLPDPTFKGISFDLEKNFPYLKNFLQNHQKVFIFNLEARSSFIKSQFNFLRKKTSEPFYPAQSLIVYPLQVESLPISAQTLVLVNPFKPTLNAKPHQDHSFNYHYQFEQENLLETFNNLFIKKETFHQIKNLQSQDFQTPEKEVVKEVVTKVVTQVRPAIQVHNGKIFPDSTRLNRFIVETNINNAYKKNLSKINGFFKPATPRKRDKLDFETASLYDDQLQSSGCAVVQDKPGKFFLFFEIQQEASLIPTIAYSLQNLFYHHFPQHDSKSFFQELKKNFEYFGKKSGCHALLFHYANYEINYYNVGIKNGFILKTNSNEFTSLTVNHARLESVHADPFKLEKASLESDDIIVVISEKILQIKNKAGDAYPIETIFNLIREQRELPPKEIMKLVVQGIEDFAYSMVENQQMILIAKALP